MVSLFLPWRNAAGAPIAAAGVFFEVGVFGGGGAGERQQEVAVERAGRRMGGIREVNMFEKQIKAGRMCAGMSFNEKVWALTARIPEGKVVTYGDIARELGTKAYRAVGNALNRNPYAPGVPCHRVVGADGGLTG
ncbi:MAG: MGMT family protein, partial [Planctomycetota bacterium]|nr:MGMT family protein [Planctomycetota bacterium]